MSHDHVEMLRLLAVDALRVKDDMRAQVLFEAADYLAFLETSMMEEMDELISRISLMEKELGSLRY